MSRKPATPLTDRLVELEAEVATLEARADELRAEARAAQDAAEAAEHALGVEVRRLALADKTTSPTADELTAQLNAAQARADEPWGIRIRALEDGAYESAQAVRQFIDDNLDGLIEELRADAEKANAQVAAAADAWRAATKARGYVAARACALLGQASDIDASAVWSYRFVGPAIRTTGLHGEKSVSLSELGLPLPSPTALARRRAIRETGRLPETAPLRGL
ncbi:MAG TPA: hypothetical protein VNZ62_07740 [Capillimicrobium sp.]|nr:hypothetical protein [Capillimicrobium sp.]